MTLSGRLCKYKTDEEHQWHWWHWFLGHAPTDVRVNVDKGRDVEMAIKRGWPFHHIVVSRRFEVIRGPRPELTESGKES